MANDVTLQRPKVMNRRTFLGTISASGIALGLSLPILGLRQAYGQSLPTAIRTRTVFNSSDLAQALAVAQPGDQILLSNGIYSGNFSLQRAGTLQAPIVIRSATPLGAAIRGNFALTAAHGWLYGLTFTEGSGPVTVAGPNCVVSHCKFVRGLTSSDGTNLFVTGVDVEVSYCEFDRLYTQGVGVSPSRGARRTRILNNYFHDNNAGTNPNCPLYIGSSPADEGIDAYCIVEGNLFLRAPQRYQETLLIKSSSNIIRYNTLLDCFGGAIFNRAGHRNQYVANYMQDGTGKGGGMCIFDRDNRVVGNVFSGANVRLEIFAGNRGPDDSIGSPPRLHPAAWNSFLVGNSGPLMIGRAYSNANPAMTVGARGTIVEAHRGAITYGRAEATVIRAYASIAVPAAAPLTTSRVGPGAA